MHSDISPTLDNGAGAKRHAAACQLSDAEPLLFSLLGALRTLDLVLEHLEFDPKADAALCNAFFDAFDNAKRQGAALRKVLAYELRDTDSDSDSNPIKGDSHAL